MKDEKSVDLKYFLNKDIKEWYLNELNNFYLIINGPGEIIYFSESSIDFFSKYDELEKKENIKDLIGNTNWVQLQNILSAEVIPSEMTILSEKINGEDRFGIKCKKIQDNNEINFMIFFRKLEDQISLEESNLNYYKEALDILNIPIVMIKDDKFFYKNRFFDEFIKDENIGDYYELKKWIKSYLAVNNYSIEDRDKNFSILIKKGNVKYSIAIEYLRNLKEVALITLIKYVEEPEIVEIEEIEPIPEETDLNIEEDNSPSTDNEVTDFINFLKEIKNLVTNLQAYVENENNDPITLLKDINTKYDEYENIIKYTSKSLLNMSENASFIDEVSVKIHLISINAAIESARSGESGKGFAVIAREIAKLSEATQNYGGLIGKQIESTREYTEKISVTEESNGTEETQKILDQIKSVQNELKSMINDTCNKIIEKLNEILQEQ